MSCWTVTDCMETGEGRSRTHSGGATPGERGRRGDAARQTVSPDRPSGRRSDRNALAARVRAARELIPRATCARAWREQKGEDSSGALHRRPNLARMRGAVADRGGPARDHGLDREFGAPECASTSGFPCERPKPLGATTPAQVFAPATLDRASVVCSPPPRRGGAGPCTATSRRGAPLHGTSTSAPRRRPHPRSARTRPPPAPCLNKAHS